MGKLIKVDSSLVIKNSADMNEYLKPMSRDILLFTTKIGNTYKLKDKTPLLKLTIGENLYFKRAESKYEDNLITISNGKNELVGYVPEVDSPIFARLMDAGKMLFAIVKSISHTTSVPLIEIEIFLKDF
jgi:hypothetical protein